MQDIAGVQKRHRIAFIDECDLPDGQDYAFVDCGGEMWLAVKRDHVTEPVLERAWAVYALRLSA